MLKPTYIIALFFLLNFLHKAAFTQNRHKFDSLKQVISTTYPDSNLIKTYFEISRLFKYTTKDSAIQYCREAVKLTDSFGLKKYKAQFFKNIGLLYFYKSDNDSAIIYFKKALKINREIGNKRGIAENYIRIGLADKYLGKNDTALIYFQKALQTAKEIGDKLWITSALKNLGNVYLRLGIYDEALNYYRQALKFNKDVGNINEEANILLDIGIVYDNIGEYDKALKFAGKALKIKKELGKKHGVAIIFGNMGVIYFRMGNYDKALEYGLKALKISKKVGDRYGVAINLGNIGDVYFQLSKFNQALNYYTRALKIYSKIKSKQGIAVCLGSIGNVYNKLSQYHKALKYEFRSLKTAGEIGELQIKDDAYSYISDSYKGLGDYKKALIYKEKWIAVHDSIFNTKITSAIASIEARYQNEIQEQQIKLQQAELEKSKAEIAQIKAVKKRKESERNLFIVAFVFMIFLATTLFYFYRHKKKDHALLMKQKQKIDKINEELNQNNEELAATLETLQQTQQQLVQAEKMASLGVLSAGIAHEINNPINFVYAGINSLLRDFEDIKPVIEEIGKINPETDNLKEKLKKIEQLKKENYFEEALKTIPDIISDIQVGADRTAEIVRSLRNFSRMDGDKKLPFNIHEGLDTALLLLKNKYKNNIEIIKNYAQDIPEIQCHPGKINQVFLNILSNAIDAIEDTGKIWITTSFEKDYVKISIKDNGHGMSDETKEKIFDPFYTTKDVGKGTGLGMSITYGIIKEHGGHIQIISEQGKGTEIIVTLPIKTR